MAGAAVLDSVGFISGVLGVVSFFQDNLPGSDPAGATVQVKAGLGDDGSSNLKGTIDHVYGYDFNNNFLGQSGSCGIGEDGGSCTVTIDQSEPGIQSDYVSIANGNDATCVAWISVKQFDDSPGGAWTGDIGQACGNDFYYGNQQAGTLPDGSPWRPYCAWFDGDHTNGYENAAVKFTVRAYGELSSDTIQNGQSCGATLFGADNGAINGVPAQPATKRALRVRPDGMKQRVIRSSFPEQTAENLCNHERSWGPDFVDSQGNFCDMETKTVSPLCSTKNVEGCVVISDKAGFRTATSGQVVRNYNVVSNWE